MKNEHARVLQPPGWTTPRGYANGIAARGYANGIAARGRLIFVGGQIGWNAQQQFESDAFVAQARQTFANVVAVLNEAGGKPEHIVRMSWYVIDKHEYVASYRELGQAYRAIIGRHFSAMTAVEVSALIEDRARVEIEATAVVPDKV